MRIDIKPNVKDGLIRFYVPEVFNEKTQKWELTHDYEQTHFKTRTGALKHIECTLRNDAQAKCRIRVEVYGIVREEFDYVKNVRKYL